MKLFILTCCLLVMAASSPVDKDVLQPVNGPAKNLSSKFSPTSSPVSTSNFHSDLKTTRANIAFFIPFDNDNIHLTTPSHTIRGSGKSSISGSGTGSGSSSSSGFSIGSGSGSGHPSGSGPGSRSKRSEKRKDSVNSGEW